MGNLEDARKIAATIEITDEIKELGEDNLGMFADDDTRLMYWDGAGTRFLNVQLTAKVIADSLHYHVEWNLTKTPDESQTAIGASKIYGLPHLPASFEWTKDLFFVAQMNLNTFAEHDKLNLLPSTGMLYFFFRESEDVLVHYFSGSPQDLTVATIPEGMSRDFTKTSGSTIEFEPGLTFHIEGDDDYTEFLDLVSDELKAELESTFGCPLTSEQVWDGYAGRPRWWQGEDELWPDDEPPENPLTLLCQMEYGEGHIHFWCNPEETRAGDFNNVWSTYSGT